MEFCVNLAWDAKSALKIDQRFASFTELVNSAIEWDNLLYQRRKAAHWVEQLSEQHYCTSRRQQLLFLLKEWSKHMPETSANAKSPHLPASEVSKSAANTGRAQLCT